MDDRNGTTFEPITRPRSEALDAILGHPYRVLHDGFVRVVDYMGDESAIVQAARTSYGKGTRTVSEDEGLIRYLMRHAHTTPYEMPQLKLHFRMPIYVARQHIRHRMSSTNEYSQRYSEAIDSMDVTAPHEWRAQSATNKQGSGAPIDAAVGARLSQRQAQLQRFAREVYEERLAEGVAREQARNDLPLSNMTELYWHIDLHNLLHFLYLRMDAHAQKEIRDYAQIIGRDFVRPWMPRVWAAFLNYRVNATTLSADETTVVQLMTTHRGERALDFAVEHGLCKHDGTGHKPTREGTEFAAKLARLGLETPWKS